MDAALDGIRLVRLPDPRLYLAGARTRCQGIISMYRITNGLVATATGASGAAVMAAVSQEGLASWTMAMLSVGATGVAWYIARRNELAHMRLMQQTESRAAAREDSRLDAELAREERMKRREERMEDLIQQITIARVNQGQSAAAAAAAKEYVDLARIEADRTVPVPVLTPDPDSPEP